MGTRAWLATIDRDGRGLRSHLRMDGYTYWAGVKLLLHYNDHNAAHDLINLGHLLNLGDEPGPADGVFINLHGHDPLLDVTRSYNRDFIQTPGTHIQLEPSPEPFDGHLADICPSEDFTPHRYAWTPDGWFAALPDDEDFQPLLHAIHREHRLNYEDCTPGQPSGPYMIDCSSHRHGIRLLQHVLPAHLLPDDPDHPTNRLARYFPSQAMIQHDKNIHANGAATGTAP